MLITAATICCHGPPFSFMTYHTYHTHTQTHTTYTALRNAPSCSTTSLLGGSLTDRDSFKCGQEVERIIVLHTRSDTRDTMSKRERENDARTYGFLDHSTVDDKDDIINGNTSLGDVGSYDDLPHPERGTVKHLHGWPHPHLHW